MRYAVVFITIFLLTSCNEDTESNPMTSKKLSKIVIENGQFINGGGDVFFPWGFNYTNADDVSLIEDDWLDENVWETIKSDFTEMKDLGANVIRIHLQYHQFMIDVETPNQVNFDRLKELVEYADDQELYLNITCLAAYRKSDQPNYYTSLSDEERWSTQKVFFEKIAKELMEYPAVFAFNLMNEPVVSVGCETNLNCEWTPGDGLGGFHFVQNVTRTPGNEFASTLKNWMSELSFSIRTNDNETLITTGLLALGSIKQFETDLDYLSPHIYPVSGEIQLSIDKVISSQSDVPLVIEETSNLYCNIQELKEFLNGIDGKYNGLMGHYHGKPLDELDDSILNDAIQKNFLQFFIDNNPN